MIYVKCTPNCTGAAIYGDFLDFQKLYDALHTIVGDEGEFAGFYSAQIRILAVCYDIRHALMGDRDVEFVENGMDADMKRRMTVLAPERNIYFKINVLWPEMLFVTMTLNDFVRLYAEKKAKKSHDFILDRRNIWDESIAMVRVLQSAVVNCIKETVSEASFNRSILTF